MWRKWLEGDAYLEGLDESRATVVDPDDGEEEAEEDDEAVVSDDGGLETVSPQLEVEEAG